ncbi:MAG: hypothetical protein JW860_08965 [Sedimentisphaerales bacterium]|nr:hypothetical protein [Sedimentisphaerales bacterium]
MDKFILNLIHRPELVPEYIDTGAREGLGEELNKTEVVSESLDIFRLQQKIAHDNGLKTTIQMTYASLYNEECIELARQYHRDYGDEIGHTFLGLNCKQFREQYQSRELAIWLFPMDVKRRIVDDSFKRFKDIFGCYPTSTGSYFMDAELLGYIKQQYPDVKIAVATCFEEGPKVFRHANYSWYTLMDGSPWTAWIPSGKNTHAIAADEEDDIGIVAVPHLSRDLLAIMDNSGDMFGTHPQNIIRGLIYEGDRLPYMYNLVDQYQVMKKYNKGFSYNLVYVGPGWLGKSGRWECDYRLLRKSYEDFLAYYGQLKKEGNVEDMTMSDFADWFRQNQPRSGPLCGLWKDILYGTRNQVFWYADSRFRVQIDLKQGGAITDLRPYASGLRRPCGAGTQANQDASYPYIVQSRYRAGAFTHYAGEGAIKSCKVRYGSEEVDLSSCRSTGIYDEADNCRILGVRPVEIEFRGLTIKLATTYTFKENTGEIIIKRKIVESSDSSAQVEVDEFLTSCWGTTEYPEDLTGCLLAVVGKDGSRNELSYEYRCREFSADNVKCVEAIIPQVQTKVSLTPISDHCGGYYEEGYSFAPNLKIGITKTVEYNQELVTCLKVEQAL